MTYSRSYGFTVGPVMLVSATVEELFDDREQYVCTANGIPLPTVAWSINRLDMNIRSPLPPEGEFTLTTNSSGDGVTIVLTYDPDEVAFDRPGCVIENEISSLRVSTSEFMDITGNTNCHDISAHI